MGRFLGNTKFGPLVEPESPFPVIGKAPQSPTYQVMEGVFGGMGEPKEVTRPYTTYTEFPKINQTNAWQTLNDNTGLIESLNAAYGTTPRFTPALYDKSKVSEYAQKFGNVGLGKAARGLNMATSKAMGLGDSPRLAESLRAALAGHGEAVDQITSGANQAALSQYNKEYDTLNDATRTNYLADIDRQKTMFGLKHGVVNQELADRNMMYEAALKAYLANT